MVANPITKKTVHEFTRIDTNGRGAACGLAHSPDVLRYDSFVSKILTDHLAVHASALNVPLKLLPADARSLGFHGLLLDAVSPALDITTLSTTGRREFRHLLAGPKLTLVGVRVDLGVKGFGPGADVDRMLERLDIILESAVALGATMTCIDLGPLPTPVEIPKTKPAINAADVGLLLLPSSTVDPAPLAPPSPPPDPAFVQQVKLAMVALGARAERYNAMVAFSSSLAGFSAVDAALAVAGCPWFGIDLDPVAIVRDRWPADEVFSRLGNQIRHVRGRDAVVGSEGRTKATVIARGDVKWRDLLDSLDSADYSGWITVDPAELPDPRAAAIAGLKQLRAYAE